MTRHFFGAMAVVVAAIVASVTPAAETALKERSPACTAACRAWPEDAREHCERCCDPLAAAGAEERFGEVYLACAVSCADALDRRGCIESCAANRARR